MRFSVIVPVYNVAEYLRDCLDSIVHQTCQDFETILIDDGSTDGSAEICDRYAAQYENFVCIHQENSGLSEARNTGLDRAQGEWVAFIDSDDWVEVDMLEWLSKYIEKEKADIYSFNMKLKYQEQREEKILFSPDNICLTFRTEEQRFRYYRDYLMQYKVGWEVCTRIFKRQLIIENKIRFVDTDKVFAEDYLFTFMYLLRVKKVCCLCHLFYNYRQRNSSLLHIRDNSLALRQLKVWVNEAYAKVCKFKMKYFRKHFEKLYFDLFQYHIQYTFSVMPIDEARKIMLTGFVSRREKEWLRKIRKEKTYVTQMGERVWL